MKILFLARLYKPHVGGVEKHVEELSKILSKKHKITLVVEQHDPQLPIYQKYPECEVYRIPLNGIDEKLKKFAIWKWWISRLNLISQADIIHFHDVFFWLLPFRLFFPRKKMFITFHGYEGSKNPSLKNILWHKAGELGTWGNICIGDFHRKWYHTKPDIVSYGAVSPKPVDHKLKGSGNEFAYLGRLASDTGIMDYLAAANKTKVRLDVYGDGPLRQKAELFCKTNQVKAKFFGFIPDADKYLKGYKLIFTSRYLGILETLVAKIPLISHYDSDIKFDYLSMAPFAEYIDICGSEAEITAAVKRINSQSPEIQSRVMAGYNWARTQTWEKLAKNYEDLWNRKIRYGQP